MKLKRLERKSSPRGLLLLVYLLFVLLFCRSSLLFSLTVHNWLVWCRWKGWATGFLLSPTDAILAFSLTIRNHCSYHTGGGVGVGSQWLTNKQYSVSIRDAFCGRILRLDMTICMFDGSDGGVSTQTQETMNTQIRPNTPQYAVNTSSALEENHQLFFLLRRARQWSGGIALHMRLNSSFYHVSRKSIFSGLHPRTL